MPHYYFHVREGSDLSRDEEGQDLPEAARREAINSSREILGEKLLDGGSLNHRTIEIADETGHVVDVVNSNDVLFKEASSGAIPMMSLSPHRERSRGTRHPNRRKRSARLRPRSARENSLLPRPPHRGRTAAPAAADGNGNSR